MNFQIIDFILCGIFLAICVYSTARGFLKRFRALISTVLAFTAMYFGIPYLFQYIKFTNSLYYAVVIFFAFVLLCTVFRFAVNGIARKAADTVLMGAADKLLGLITGIVEGIIIILILAFILYLYNKDVAKQSFIINNISGLFSNLERFTNGII